MKNFLLNLKESIAFVCFIFAMMTTPLLMAQDCNPVGIFPWTDTYRMGISPCYEQIYMTGDVAWEVRTGGYQAQSGLIGYPEFAHSDSLNLYFFSPIVGSKTKLILPEFDLEGGTNLSMRFWHAQYPWAGSQDVLNVYYKNSSIGDWILLASYTEAIEGWTEHTIELPNPTSTYKIAFEGVSGYGRGIVIDDVTINCTGCVSGCAQPRNVSRIVHSPNYFDVQLAWNMPDTAGYLAQFVGYNIYKDGTLLTATPITEETYQIYNLPSGNHGFGITAVYSDNCESEKAPVNCIIEQPPYFCMPTSGTVVYRTCDAMVYDDGCANGNYSNNCNGILVLQPDEQGYGARIEGTYSLENNNDKLYVYEGYGTAGDLLATYTGSGSIPSTLSNIGPISLRFISNASTTNTGFAIQVSCSEIGSCLPPYGLSATMLNLTTAQLSWMGNDENGIYNLEYGNIGYQQGTGTRIDSVTTPYTLSELTPYRQYSFYVQTACEEGETSIWAGPYTFSASLFDCGIIGAGTTGNYTIPINTYYNHSYTQQIFTAEEMFDQGISIGNTINSIAFQYFYATAQTKDPVTVYLANTTKTAFASSSDWEPFNNLQQVFTGAINLNNTGEDYWVEIEFSENFTWNGSNLLVAVLNNNGSYTTSSNNTFYTHTTTGNKSLRYQVDGSTPIAPATVPSGTTGTIRNNLKFCSGGGGGSVCQKPSEITITNVTASSAHVAWNAGGTETVWNVEYGLQNFLQGSGTQINGLTTTSCDLTNLSASCTYDVYVQAVCGEGDISAWRSSSFTTDCGAVVIPYSESFDTYGGSGASVFPDCWTRLYSASTANPQINTAQKYSPPACLSFYTSATNYSIGITPELIVGAVNTLQVRFMGRASNADHKLQIGVMTDITDTSTFVLVETVQVSETNTWEEVEVSLASYSGTGKYVAFKSDRRSESSTNYFYIDDLVIENIPSCPRPSGLTASNPTASSIDLTWLAGGSETTWNIEYGVAGFTQGAGTLIQNAGNSSYTLSGLLSNTTYDAYIQAVCSTDEVSEWRGPVTFTTTCGSVAIPFSDNFDTYGGTGASVFPDCWTRMHSSTTANPYIYTTQKYSPPASLYFNSNASNYSIGVTPQLNVASINTLHVRFMGRSANTNHKLQIGVMTVPTDTSTFVLVGIVQVSTANTWEEFEVSLASYSGTGKYVAFKSDRRSESSANNFCIDDLVIETIPSCPRPSGLTASNPTASTVDLTWLAGGSETTWNIEYGVAGFTQGAGTSVQNVGNPYTLTGLSSNTFYDVYVQAVCGADDLSGWIGPVSFNTACGTVTAPFLENFDNYGTGTSARPSCWTIEGTYSTLPYCYATYSYSSPASLRLYSSSTTYVYVATPEFNVENINTLQVNFWGYSASTSNIVEIGVMTDPLDIETFDSISTKSVSATSTWEYFEVPLNEYTGNGKYIAFRSTRSSANTFYIDDVLIDVIPSCPRPSDLSAEDITANAVTLEWTNGGTETSWKIEYGRAGFNPGSGAGQTVIANTNPYTVTGLSSETTYDFYLYAICGEGDISDYRALQGITTLISCDAPTNFALTGITETTASISWTANGDATLWNIEYGPEGFELGTGVPIYNIPNTLYTIIGLESGVRYNCYVRSVCSQDNMSVWVGPIAFSSGTIDCGVIGEGTTGTSYFPLNTFYKYCYTQQIFTAEELIALGINAGEINAISFQYFYETPMTRNNIIIYFANTTKTDFSSGSDWETFSNLNQVFSGDLTFDNTGEDYWFDIELDDAFLWNGSSSLLVAVLNNHGTYNNSSNKFYTHTATNRSIYYQTDGSPISAASPTSGIRTSNRNNIKLCFVQSEPPTCIPPTNLTASDITSNAAMLSWLAVGSENMWNIELGEKGFMPTMTPTFNNVDNPHPLTGLTPNTDYAYYVQSNCGGGETSDWFGPYLFTTACDMVLEIPFVEGFEEGVKPVCWIDEQILSSVSWSYQAGCIESTPDTAFEGNLNALLYSTGNKSITRLVTPTINLSGLTETPILAFAHAQPVWGYGQDKLSVWVKNSPDGNWSKVREYTESIDNWVEESIVLPNPTATYWLAFEVEGNWGHGAALDNVTVLQDEVAEINGNIAVCANSSETYTTAPGMTDYVWEVSGGEITSGQGTNSITVLWGATGEGMVNVIYAGLTYMNNMSIVITETPEAAAYASDYEICAGSSTTLTVLGEGNYLWSTGETTSSIVVTPTETTTYTVSVYDNLQCANVLEITIIVNSLAEIEIEGETHVCYGESTVLTVSVGEYFLWSTGETTPSIVVSPEVTTYYSVLVTDDVGCSGMDSINVYVTEVLPITNFASVGDSSGFIALTWSYSSEVTKFYIYRDGVLYDSTAFNSYNDHDIQFHQEYCYMVIAFKNGCESDESETTCSTAYPKVIGIDENVDNVHIYPNPANDYLTVEGLSMKQVSVFNVLGQEIETFNVNDLKLLLNTAGYESGMYIIRIETKNGTTVSKRIVVAH